MSDTNLELEKLKWEKEKWLAERQDKKSQMNYDRLSNISSSIGNAGKSVGNVARYTAQTEAFANLAGDIATKTGAPFSADDIFKSQQLLKEVNNSIDYKPGTVSRPFDTMPNVNGTITSVNGVPIQYSQLPSDINRQNYQMQNNQMQNNSPQNYPTNNIWNNPPYKPATGPQFLGGNEAKYFKTGVMYAIVILFVIFIILFFASILEANNIHTIKNQYPKFMYAGGCMIMFLSVLYIVFL